MFSTITSRICDVNGIEEICSHLREVITCIPDNLSAPNPREGPSSMKKKEVPSLAKKLKSLRDELHLTQKEVADKAKITESAYRAYELGDRNPKPEILDRIAKVLGVRPEFLSAPTFRNRREFAYAILENEDAFGYTVRDIDGVPAIVKGYGNAMDFFAEFVRDWEQMRAKLDNHEITQEEYEAWKRTWDNGTWVKTDDDKSPYTGKQMN